MTGQELYIYILNSNIINFVIMISLLVLIFKRAHLGSMIDSIADDIKNNVVSSTEAVQNALSKYKKTKKELKNIDVKKAEIINNAKQTSELLKEANRKAIELKEKELDKNSEKIQDAYAEVKTQKTVQEIQNAIYTLSLDTIHRINNEELQKKLILNALDEFDKIEGAEKW